ncbi:hypothetical protein EG327_002101 [Venturia inaequalis]|uniref:Glycoside hydrolase family 16 protein n=1 Tax=Venturia inaequalis TaxID=5025 RepID=A0A8H3VNA0_VENIN|nr:hypothetical protein EG327_002101 [Venturia inaequalis]
MSAFWFLSAYLAQTVLAQYPATDCTSFTTNGIAASTFQYYRFYDFRNLNPTSSCFSNPLSSSVSSTRTKIVKDESWTSDWFVRDFPRNSPGGTVIPVNFTNSHVSITNSTDQSRNYNSYLTLSTTRSTPLDQPSGEITYTEHNITHASIRVFSRIHGSPGAIAGIFTYKNDTQEADIEIFTRAPANKIQYSNQPADLGAPDWTLIPGATSNVTLPKEGRWDEWMVHRLDWVPGRTVVYADEVQVNTSTLHVPSAVVDPIEGTRLYLDMWGANSTWSGSMEVGKSAFFDVQWIEVLFNTTDSAKATDLGKKKCDVGAVDNEAVKQAAGVKEAVGGWGLFETSFEDTTCLEDEEVLG